MNEKIKLGEMFFEVNHNINYSTYYSLYKIFDEYYFVFGMLAKDFRENASLVTTYPKIDKLLNGRIRGNTQDRNSVDIDVLYFTRSSKKWCSTAFRQMAYNFGTKKYVWDKDIFTPLIMKFYNKWESLLTTLDLDYNPIHNYDMTEDEKVNTYLETSDNVDKYTNGFNSSTASPTDKSENTITVDGDWDNNKRQLTRKGNIGVTTTQQMLEAEIKLRQYNILEQMFEDVDSVLTLSIY